MNDEGRLKQRLEAQARRMKRAREERDTLMAQTVYIGALGLVFVLPVLGGAYLGRWLDGLAEGYSVLWTVVMIFLGLVVGVVNVYYFVRG